MNWLYWGCILPFPSSLLLFVYKMLNKIGCDSWRYFFIYLIYFHYIYVCCALLCGKICQNHIEKPKNVNIIQFIEIEFVPLCINKFTFSVNWNAFHFKNIFNENFAHIINNLNEAGGLFKRPIFQLRIFTLEISILVHWNIINISTLFHPNIHVNLNESINSITISIEVFKSLVTHTYKASVYLLHKSTEFIPKWNVCVFVLLNLYYTQSK